MVPPPLRSHVTSTPGHDGNTVGGRSYEPSGGHGHPDYNEKTN